MTWRALGVAGTFEVARASAYGYDQRCEVWTATGAALSVGNHAATSLKVGGAAGVVASPLVESFPERFRAAFAEDVAHCLDVAGRRRGGEVHSWRLLRALCGAGRVVKFAD